MCDTFYYTGIGAVEIRGSVLSAVSFQGKITTASFVLDRPFSIQKAIVRRVSGHGKSVLVVDVLTTSKEFYRFYKKLKDGSQTKEPKERVWKSELIPPRGQPYRYFTEETDKRLIATNVRDIHHSMDGILYSFCGTTAIFTPDGVDYDVCYVSPDGHPSRMIADYSAKTIISNNTDCIILGLEYTPPVQRLPARSVSSSWEEDLGEHEPVSLSHVWQPPLMRYIVFVDPSKEFIDHDRMVKPGRIFYTRVINQGVFVYEGTDGKYYLYDPHSHPATDATLDKPDYLTRSRIIELSDVKRIWVAIEYMALWKENGETEFFLKKTCEKFVIPDLIEVNSVDVNSSTFLVVSESSIDTLRGEKMSVFNVYASDKQCSHEITVVRPRRLFDSSNYYFTVKNLKIVVHSSSDGNSQEREMTYVEPGETVYLGASVVLRGENSTHYVNEEGKRLLLGGSHNKSMYKIEGKIDPGLLTRTIPISLVAANGSDIFQIIMTAAQLKGYCEKNELYGVTWKIMETGKVLHGGNGVTAEVLSRLGDIIRERFLQGDRFVHWSPRIKEMTKHELYLLGLVIRMVCLRTDLPRLPLGFLLAVKNLEWTLNLHRMPTVDDYEYFAETFNPDAFAGLSAMRNSPDAIKACGFETYHAALAHFCEMDQEMPNITENNMIAKGFIGKGFEFFRTFNLGSISAYFSGNPAAVSQRKWKLDVVLNSGCSEQAISGKIQEFRDRAMTLDASDYAVLMRNWTGATSVGLVSLTLKVVKRKANVPDFNFNTCRRTLKVCQDLFENVEGLLEALCLPEYEFQTL